MKIAYIAIKGLPMSGGIEKYTQMLSNHLHGRGHEITVYTTSHYGNLSGQYEGFTIKTVPSIKNKYLEKISLVLSATIHQVFCEYDIVHYHALGPSIFAFIPRLQGKKVVIQSHGIEYQRSRWGKVGVFVLKTLEKLSYNMGDALTVVSKPLQRYFMDAYGKESFYIPTAVDLPEEEKEYESYLQRFGAEKDSYYLFMARLVKEKGAHYLIEAFKKAKSNRKLLIAGKIDENNTYHQAIRKLAQDDPRIAFVGEVLGDEKDALFRGAYAFCLPSEIEGMSIALLEAMSYKKCCIVSDISENLDVAEGRALVFRSKNVDSLVETLEKADVLSVSERNMYCIGAYSFVKENNSFDIVAKQMETLYEKVRGIDKCE